jgi:hypothetical protein
VVVHDCPLLPQILHYRPALHRILLLVTHILLLLEVTRILLLLEVRRILPRAVHRILQLVVRRILHRSALRSYRTTSRGL